MLAKVSGIPAQRLYRPLLGRDNQGSFFIYMFLLLFSLPFSVLVFLVAILSHRQGFSQPLADLATYTTYTTVIGSATLWWPLSLFLSHSEMFSINTNCESLPAMVLVIGIFLVWNRTGRFSTYLQCSTIVIVACLPTICLDFLGCESNGFFLGLLCLRDTVFFWLLCILVWIPLIIAYFAHYNNGYVIRKIFQVMIFLYLSAIVYLIFQICFYRIFKFWIIYNIVFAIIVLIHPILEHERKEEEQMQRRNIGFEFLNMLGRLVMVLVFSIFYLKRQLYMYSYGIMTEKDVRGGGNTETGKDVKGGGNTETGKDVKGGGNTESGKDVKGGGNTESEAIIQFDESTMSISSERPSHGTDATSPTLARLGKEFSKSFGHQDSMSKVMSTNPPLMKMTITQREKSHQISPTDGDKVEDEFLTNPNDQSNGYHKFRMDLINFDPSIIQYCPKTINHEFLKKEWKHILRCLLPHIADEMIHSIQEVFGIEENNHKIFTTFSLLRKSLASGELNIQQIKDNICPILEKVKITTLNAQLLENNSALSDPLEYNAIDDINVSTFTTLIKKGLPNLAIPIIGAISKLYVTDKGKAKATQHILSRYCMMNYTSLEAIEEARCSNFSIYSHVYDVVINKSLPENLKDKEALKDEVISVLNSIKTNRRLREWLTEIHDQRCYSYGWPKIDGSLTQEDFKLISFKILDIFYGTEVHISFKFFGFDIVEEQNPNEHFRSKLVKLNHVYRIALENLDDIVTNSTSINVKNNIITIGITLESEADAETLLLDHFRDIWGKGACDDSYRQELLLKLKKKFPNLSYMTTENILELFKNESYRDIKKLKIQVRKTPCINDVLSIEGYVLWPNETRRLSELPNDWFTKLYGMIVKFIPEKFHKTIGRTFINNSSLYTEGVNSLKFMEEARNFLFKKEDMLFKIFGHFRKNGGTVGDLQLALKECSTYDVNLEDNENEEKIPHVKKLLLNIVFFIDETYSKWKSSFETKLPGTITNRKEFEDFFRNYGLGPMPKMKVSEFNQKLRNGEISNGDQIWMWRNSIFTNSYAHVGIFVEKETLEASEFSQNLRRYYIQNSIVHVTPRNGTTLKHLKNDETSKISCELVNFVIHANDEVFVVRYTEGDGDEFSGEEIARRALACCNPKIIFSYSGYFASCETFASKICGVTSIQKLNMQGFLAACRGGKKKIIADHVHNENNLDELIQKIDARLMQIAPEIMVME